MSTGDSRNADLTVMNLYPGEGHAFVWREAHSGKVFLVISELVGTERKVAGVMLDQTQAEELSEALLYVAGVPRGAP